jgi:outer membrane murein-binding lipoprotein Lpp
MRRAILAAMILWAPLAATSADDLKVSQLDQDVRDLRRQVQDQQRQIDALRTQLARPATTVTVNPATAPAADPHIWVDASKWQRIRLGMSELEVVGVLGRPTSMRGQEGQRVLLYAMEIGSSGFLGGSVTFRDRVVVAVQNPVLK